MSDAAPIKVYWWHGTPNFGDALSPLAVAYASGRPFVHASPAEMDVLGAGSIMARASRRYSKPQSNRPVIWGTGMKAPLPTSFVENVDFAAVRGPVTANLLGLPPITYGDPGLLMERAATTKVERGDTIGIVPHHTHFDARSTKNDVDALKANSAYTIIDPRNDDPPQVIDQIRGCRHVFSASLHGLIIADAFGIPSTWVALAHDRKPPLLKYMDYFCSIGRPYSDPIGYSDIESAARSLGGADTLPYAQDVEAAKDALLESFPKKLKAI